MPRQELPQARLGWRLKGEWLDLDLPGPNRVAAESLVSLQRERLRVTEIDEAMVVGLVMLAEAVDADPTNAALWGQYRAAEHAVKAAVPSVVKGSKVDELANRRASRSAGTADPRPAGRRAQPRRSGGGHRTG